jgi:U4/U6 small nuclear ribonucleoprotein PRP3
MVVPIHLTDKEKKRLRRMKRLDKEKDKQEKVKLGLMPVPLPKVKLSNYMKIMGKEAIADPSRVEQKVKQIVEQRLEAHLKRNEDNKLTREQREAKMRRKHERDIVNNECRIAVFKVDTLKQPHLKFKVDMNAQQFHMGGFCLIADQTMAPDLPNLVIVEGGPRAIKKFKRLMLRRVDWNSKAKSKKSQKEEGAE